MDNASFPKLAFGLTVSTREEIPKALLLWEEVRTSGKHPARRSYHSAVMWGEKMLIYGGQDISEGPQGGLWSIEIGQFGHDSWELLNVEDKGSFSHHSAVLKNNKMYIFGGTTGSEEFNRTLILDLRTLQWQELPGEANLPPALDSHTACLYQNKMIVFGGYSNGEPTNGLYILNLDSLKWSKLEPMSSQAPEARSGHSAVVFQDGLYIFGGISDEGEKLNDFWKLDLTTNTWAPVHGEGDLPTGRSGHSAVIYKELLVIFGGVKDITKETNDMYSFNFLSNIWTLFQYEHQVKDPVSNDQLEEFKKNRANLAEMREKKNSGDFSPVRISPRKPANGENSRGSPARRGSIEVENAPRRRRTLYAGPLNPTEGRIRGKLPHPRDGHSAVVNGDIMIIFGGDRHQMPFNDTYVYYLVEENMKTPVSTL